jgi:DNA-binding MurR/RpiR family transcriptional regulator
MASAPVNYDQLKETISRLYEELPKQLQRIAQYALDKPNELALGTVASVAEAAGVQPSALIRFANALQFGGFSEMQQVFRGRLIERSSSYRERIGQLSLSGQAPARGAGLVHQFVGEAVAELEHLDESVRAADLAAATKLLCSARRIHVLAQRRAFPVACYLAYALSQLELKTCLIDGVGGMLAEGLRNIDRGDVLIATSFRNYSPDVIAAAQAVHGRGLPVIAITDSALSPLKPWARVCFELSESPAAFPSLVAPLCLAQALVVGAGQRLTTSPKQSGGPKPRRSAANGLHP